MKILYSIVLATLLFTTNIFAFNPQELEAKVDALLQKNEITKLANKLAKKKSSSTEELLIKLSVFSRAGHHKRIHQTLQKIGEIYPSSSNQKLILSAVTGHLGTDDLKSLKIFYEKIAVKGDRNVGVFIKLWREKNVYELENWLETKANLSNVWWEQLVKLRHKSKKCETPPNSVKVYPCITPPNVNQELEKRIKANPKDSDAVEKYLLINKNVIHKSYGNIITTHDSDIRNDGYFYYQDITWLADIIPLETAYETYEFSRIYLRSKPETAIRFFKKSLELPFTKEDKQLFAERFNKHNFFGYNQHNAIKNPEKQVRFWTKIALVNLYRLLKKDEFAHQYIKELIELDKSDIETTEIFRLAGQVESSTGKRTIEKHILKDERNNLNSPKYWLKRARYYEGRKENEKVWKIYLQALERYKYFPNNYNKSSPRISFLHAVLNFMDSSNESEIGKIFRKEFLEAKSVNDVDYIFELLYMFNNNLETLRDEFFVNTKFLPEVLSFKTHWSEREMNFSWVLMESDKWTKAQENLFWKNLFDLAMQEPKLRAYALADILEYQYPQMTVLLLEKTLEVLEKEDNKKLPFAFDSVRRKLLSAYLENNDWKKAEEFYLKNNAEFSSRILGRIAVIAAKQDDIKDAVRLWKLNTNFDRRRLKELKELTTTEAKLFLQKFYSDMKKRDPLTNIPDKALAILK